MIIQIFVLLSCEAVRTALVLSVILQKKGKRRKYRERERKKQRERNREKEAERKKQREAEGDKDK